MLVGKGAGDVESGEQGKDIRLQTLDQKLEEGQANAESEGKGADQFQTNDPFEQMISAQNKNEEKQVTREHVRE